MKYSEEENKAIEYIEECKRKNAGDIAEIFKSICVLKELVEKQEKENEKAYLQGFKDSEEKYNTVIAENMKLKEELAKKDKCIMKLKNLNRRLMKKR